MSARRRGAWENVSNQGQHHVLLAWGRDTRLQQHPFLLITIFFFLGGVGGCRARQGPRNGCGEHRQDEGLSKARVVSSRESMLEGKLALGTLVREEKAKEKEGGMR